MTRAGARVGASLVLMLPLAMGLVGCSPATSAPEPPPAVDAPREQESAPEKAKPDPAEAAVLEQNAALDRFVAAGQAQLPQLIGSFDGMYADIQITGVYPDTIEYDYVYAQQLDAVGAAEAFETMIPTYQTACDSDLFPAMSEAGIVVDPKARYTYYNADGSEIWSHTFERS